MGGTDWPAIHFKATRKQKTRHLAIHRAYSWSFLSAFLNMARARGTLKRMLNPHKKWTKDGGKSNQSTSNIETASAFGGKVMLLRLMSIQAGSLKYCSIEKR
jgi:hypothetical protein